MVEVVKVRAVRPHILEIEFSDGKRRKLDVGRELKGEVFELLKDPEYFALAV